MMRSIAFVAVLHGSLALQLGGMGPLARATSQSRFLPVRLSKGIIPGFDADEVENCVVESENPAEAAACADPPADPTRPKLSKWEIPGYLSSDEGRGPTNCRRGTHGLDECLAEAENAKETADCYEDYGVAPPA
jgi:hypothetical protein